MKLKSSKGRHVFRHVRLYTPYPKRGQWVLNQSFSFAARTPAMPLSGEAIRLMNYIDDVSVTLRRILTGVATLDDDERALVSAHLAQAKPSAKDVLNALAAK